MKILQQLRAHLFKVLLSVVATLLVVQYWRQITFDSRPLEPMYLLNSSRTKFGFLAENGSTIEELEEYFNGSYSQNNSLYTPEEVTANSPLCPRIPPNLHGRIKIRRAYEKLSVIEKDFEDLEPGGAFRPKECKSRYVVALVIPYRDRPLQLAIFLNNIHRMLMRQQRDYRIFVVEQEGDSAFNRGKLMNVGFVEASKLRNYDCFIFHDVDLIPEDDRNLYSCVEQPKHMSVAVDKFKYRLPYQDLFGGVCAISKEQFQVSNGFSNNYWGWGGEDDDLYSRLKSRGFHIARDPVTIARYTMLPHEKQKPNPNRFELMRKGKWMYSKDGLNSLKYKRKALENRKLYTWILADLQPPQPWYQHVLKYLNFK